jgi:hypothetical protein
MPEPTQSVREFVSDSYQIISANTPTVPLHGNDLSKGIALLNRLLNQYSATGLMLTIAKQVDFPILTGQGVTLMGPSDYVQPPGPVLPIITTEGRLANLENAWITLEHVTYPLIDVSRNKFFASYKYDTLAGLPRYIIIKPQTNVTEVQVFPAPSQQYLLSIYGKFQLSNVTSSDDMSSLPTYYQLYLQFALAKFLAAYKGRMSAWTPDLEATYLSLKADMEAATSQNLDINTNNESWLNGKWRVISGI